MIFSGWSQILRLLPDILVFFLIPQLFSFFPFPAFPVQVGNLYMQNDAHN